MLKYTNENENAIQIITIPAYSVIKLSSNSSEAVALFRGSGSKHLLMKAMAVSDISEGMSGWALWNPTLNMAASGEPEK